MLQLYAKLAESINQSLNNPKASQLTGETKLALEAIIALNYVVMAFYKAKFTCVTEVTKFLTSRARWVAMSF